MKEKIIELLLSTNCPGMDKLIEWMEQNGFFTAPCSSQYHLCKEGGLEEHSYNVYRNAVDISMALRGEHETLNIYDNELIITTLLHDLGKTGQFGKSNYIENMISDRKGGFKRSDKKPYTTNSELLYVDHEIRSIQIASQFIELTEEESFAILYHNGMYSNLKYALNGKETPLQMILHFADLWCSRVIEKKEKESEK